jgi:hypothetical protein
MSFCWVSIILTIVKVTVVIAECRGFIVVLIVVILNVVIASDAAPQTMEIESSNNHNQRNSLR